MKATLGIGFEDRSPAFDFGIALTECRKTLGFEQGSGGQGQQQRKEKKVENVDFSLKEGEKIVVNVPGKGRRNRPSGGGSSEGGSDAAALFSIAPPPPAANSVPPSSLQMGHQAPTPGSEVEGKTAAELGFDDGEFGEFQ